MGAELAAPVVHCDRKYEMLFILYAVFVTFGLCNIFTGMVVHMVQKRGKANWQQDMCASMASNKAFIMEVKAAFGQLAPEGKVSLSALLGDQGMKQLLRANG